MNDAIVTTEHAGSKEEMYGLLVAKFEHIHYQLRASEFVQTSSRHIGMWIRVIAAIDKALEILVK